ncbi:hydrogenase expression protein HypF [Streptomyces sp. B1866]|uniref:hydrogenase expression protein HypF n=1 Tax=Streptomyces sp. B1866 TaxID=3075431 RepID=UPI00288EC37A|nr:hydrogenase expression protein HypF [Streptomyces sp. B1866]MDT3399409.1 hydrogenase expression protein HypF [Streptomyces sp. B1866]
MPGDEERADAATPRRPKAGPRHAAPRKSVLGRLHVPAGKAMAIAAMPTAILMGMGLTPQLARASAGDQDQFKPGPCVTQPDGTPSPEPTPDPSAAAGKAARAGAADGGSGGTPAPSPSPRAAARESGQAGDGGAGAGAGAGAGEAGATGPAPSASRAPKTGLEATARPSASPGTGPAAAPSDGQGVLDLLDPLGLKRTLTELLTGGQGGGTPAPRPSASPSPSATAPAPASPAPGPSSAGTGPSGTPPAQDAQGGRDAQDADGPSGNPAGKAGGSPAPAASSAPAAPEPSASPSAAADGADGGDGGDLQPYPCPTFDAEAYANAEEEPTASLLPNDPWTLECSVLTLHGLKYHGIVQVKQYSGELKRVLKFTASAVDIRDLHQSTVGAGGGTTHVKARPGSVSTFRDGTVTMYTEELKGNLLGLIPVTFSPKTPPPLNLSEVFFTSVTVRQAGQFGGELTIPGMHLYQTGE